MQGVASATLDRPKPPLGSTGLAGNPHGVAGHPSFFLFDFNVLIFLFLFLFLFLFSF
jgi:hypothetical protein